MPNGSKLCARRTQNRTNKFKKSKENPAIVLENTIGNQRS
jgi:hypothetical protein